MRASTVSCVGSRMSSNRLCVRISNCSRDFLSTCGERNTVFVALPGGAFAPREVKLGAEERMVDGLGDVAFGQVLD